MSDPVEVLPLTPDVPTAEMLGSPWVTVTLVDPPPPHFGDFLRSWIGGVKESNKKRYLLIQGLGWVEVAERMEYLRLILDMPPR